MAEADRFEKLRQRSFPWCTIVLVLCATACHVCVLVGNFKTAKAMEEMGTSTKGWSQIGVGVAQSLETELDHRMQNVSARLLDSLSHLGVVGDAIEAVLSMVGVQTDGVLEAPTAREDPNGNATARASSPGAASGKPSLLQSAQAELQEGRNMTDVFGKLYPVVLNSVHDVLDAMVSKVSDLLAQMFEKLKPALEQVGEWIIKFGDKIQSGLSVFSVTVDRVQKMFDQIMEKLQGYGENEGELLNQTFNLFDVSNTGYVTAKDLQDVSTLYSITALQGQLPAQLVSKYDVDGDGQLTKPELLKLVNDPAIPDSMTVVLRTYAKRLAEVAGVVAKAKQRDEVAKAVVDYLELVCAKNQTKVAWLADRLGNETLPLEFTGDVLVQLCLNEDDPNRLTTADVGANVVGKMYDLHPEQTMAAVELLSNSTYWLSEGFEAPDQPVCVKRVTEWVTNASSISTSRSKDGIKGVGDSSVVELLRNHGEVPVHADLMKAFPSILEAQCEASIAREKMARQRDRTAQRGTRFSSRTSQLLLSQLLGGASPADVGAPTLAEQAVQQGIPARPETLEFAQWLSNNASSTAKKFQNMCFKYSGSSSNAVDSIAASIQGVVSQTKGFIDMMTRYATPAAIDRLEDQIAEFTETAMGDVQKVIEKRVASLMGNSSEVVDQAIERATHKAGEELGHMIGKVISSPFAQAIKEPMGELMGNIVSNPKVSSTLGEKLGDEVADAVSNLTGNALADKAGDILETLLSSALSKGGNVLENGIDSITGKITDSLGREAQPKTETALASEAVRRLQERRKDRIKKASLLQWQYQTSQQSGAAGAQARAEMLVEADESEAGGEVKRPEFLDKLPAAVSGAWEAIVNLIGSLMNLLPSAVNALKNARKEVAKLYSHLFTTFSTFEVRGPPVFDDAATLWRKIWCAYFLCLLPLNCLMVYYAMWAGGYFGGPAPVEDDEVVPPMTWQEKGRALLRACSGCMRKCHDSELGFWSIVILLELVVLVIFAVSVALCILGGVKVLLVQGCGEVYILHDETICTETLTNLRNFLGTFLLDSSMTPVNGVGLDQACNSYKLLTCDMIVQHMKVSTALTTVFSFLATLISLQLIIDSAVMHEQATFRRLANEFIEKQADRGQPGAAASSTA